MHVIHANPSHIFLKVKQIKIFVIRNDMYQELIDPPSFDWEEYEIYLDWLEDHLSDYDGNESAAEYAYQNRLYQEEQYA